MIQLPRRTIEGGFTLLETLVALLLFSIVSAAAIPAMVMHLRANHSSAVRSGAFAAAQRVLDEIRDLNPETLPSSGEASPQEIVSGLRTYEAVVSYCEDSTHCTTRSRFLTVRVSYQGEQVYEVSTVFTRLR